MRFIFALLLYEGIASGAGFYQTAPPALITSLEAQLPKVIRALSGDPELMRTTGAKSAAELREARFNFSQTARLHDIDYRALDKAGSFEELVVATNQYSVPLCIRNQCLTMALVTWTSDNPQAKLQYIGRDMQQSAFHAAAARVAHEQNQSGLKLIATDILNYVFVPEEGGSGYLISATETQERELENLLQRRKPLKKDVWRMTVQDFKKVVETRAKSFDNSDLDEFRVAPGETTDASLVVTPGAVQVPSPSGVPIPVAETDSQSEEPTQKILPLAKLGLVILLLVLLAVVLRKRRR